MPEDNIVFLSTPEVGSMSQPSYPGSELRLDVSLPSVVQVASSADGNSQEPPGVPAILEDDLQSPEYSRFRPETSSVGTSGQGDSLYSGMVSLDSEFLYELEDEAAFFGLHITGNPVNDA